MQDYRAGLAKQVGFAASFRGKPPITNRHSNHSDYLFLKYRFACYYPRMHTPNTCWDPAKYRSAAGFVADHLGADVLEFLEQHTELRDRTVLDLGCGDGVLSERLAERGAVVTGIDSSPEMIAAAQARRTSRLTARVLDADALKDEASFVNAFDVVFTNATLHWIRNKAAVLTGAHRALRNGGLFVGEFGGGANVRIIRDAVTTACHRAGHPAPEFPWHFPERAEFAAMLNATGFRDIQVHELKRRPVLPEGIAGWLETFGSSIAADVTGAERDAMWRTAQEIARPQLFYDGEWHADYVRLRFVAWK